MASSGKAGRLVAGNWKMNGLFASLQEVAAMRQAIIARPPGCEVLICPPTTLLAAARGVLQGAAITLGGQDCHIAASGAFTGDISAEMLKDAGAQYVILGHSERRHGLGESDELVAKKAQAALLSGLKVIICVGETEAERDAGQAQAVVGRQLQGSICPEMPVESLVVAYEPVWAIGTGRVPSNADIEAVHNFIRGALEARFGDSGAEVSILYGGSVKPDNAKELLALSNVNGALVGGASLKSADFCKIVAAT